MVYFHLSTIHQNKTRISHNMHDEYGKFASIRLHALEYAEAAGWVEKKKRRKEKRVGKKREKEVQKKRSTEAKDGCRPERHRDCDMARVCWCKSGVQGVRSDGDARTSAPAHKHARVQSCAGGW